MNSALPDLILLVFLLIKPCLALKKQFGDSRFEEFEEDLVSVVLRTFRF